MAISMLKIRRPLGRLIFNMGIAIPGKTVFLIETAPWFLCRKIMSFPIPESELVPRWPSELDVRLQPKEIFANETFYAVTEWKRV